MIELGQKSKPQKTPEPKINNDNREVHDTAEVVAERPEVSSPSQFDASHMLVSGGKLRRPFIVDAFENVQTDLGTLPPPPSPPPLPTHLYGLQCLQFKLIPIAVLCHGMTQLLKEPKV